MTGHLRHKMQPVHGVHHADNARLGALGLPSISEVMHRWDMYNMIMLLHERLRMKEYLNDKTLCHCRRGFRQ